MPCGSAETNRRLTRRSRMPHVKGPLDKSASGSGVKRCGACSSFERSTKQVVHNGLQLLRTRYGIPYSELPDCEVGELSRLLSFLLLQGKERDPVAFPRRQRAVRNSDGLCSLQRLGRRHRWELAHSMASIKRNLPGGCRTHTPSRRSSWEENACSQPLPLSFEFEQHVRRVCTRIFTPGWDRNYESFVGTYCANATSRLPLRSRADRLWAGRREDFFTATTSESDLGTDITGRYKEVLSAGKCRPMLIFDEKVDLLGPLHRCMYNHLCRSNWLLCGPPTEERITSVCANRVQTSVDLVNATDNLSTEVAEIILDCAFFNSLKVPRSLRRLARGSLRPFFEGEDGTVHRVTRGQMMGSYLSFPLLCVQSYIAATWAARFDEHARFLVNGDDTVISASRGVTVQDYPPGYRLNDDKTIRAEGVVEINSTAFLHQKGRWREVRHIRRAGAPTDFPGMLHMAKAALDAGPAFVDAFTRSRIGRRWGFLPSQLGHFTYASYLRERQMSVRRNFSELPTSYERQDETSLRRIYGRDPRPLESEALRALMWNEGRRGGMKRDVFDPSCGRVRRTYCYVARPRRVITIKGKRSFNPFRSFRWRPGLRYALPNSSKARFFLVPDDFETEEEERARYELERYRSALAGHPVELFPGCVGRNDG